MAMKLAITAENPAGWKRMGVLDITAETVGQKYYLYIDSDDNFKGVQLVREVIDFPVVTVEITPSKTLQDAIAEMETARDTAITAYLLDLNTPA